jgi:hypothetical protein
VKEMSFLIFVVLVVIAILLWKLTDFTPDLAFQIRELRSELAAIRSLLENNEKIER